MIFLEAVFWTATACPTEAFGHRLACRVRVTPPLDQVTVTRSPALITCWAATSRRPTAAPARSGRRAAMPTMASASAGRRTGAPAALAQTRSLRLDRSRRRRGCGPRSGPRRCRAACAVAGRLAAPARTTMLAQALRRCSSRGRRGGPRPARRRRPARRSGAGRGGHRHRRRRRRRRTGRPGCTRRRRRRCRPCSVTWPARAGGGEQASAAQRAGAARRHDYDFTWLAAWQHLVGGGDDLGVHLVGPLRDDQGGDFADRVDVRGFGVALHQGAEADRAGRAGGRRRPRRRFPQEQVVADGFEAAFVDEGGQFELADHLRPVWSAWIDLTWPILEIDTSTASGGMVIAGWIW